MPKLTKNRGGGTSREGMSREGTTGGGEGEKRRGEGENASLDRKTAALVDNYDVTKHNHETQNKKGDEEQERPRKLQKKRNDTRDTKGDENDTEKWIKREMKQQRMQTREQVISTVIGDLGQTAGKSEVADARNG